MGTYNHPMAHREYAEEWNLYRGLDHDDDGEIVPGHKCDRCGRCCMAWPCYFTVPKKNDDIYNERPAIIEFVRGKVKGDKWRHGFFGLETEMCVTPIFVKGRCPFLIGDAEPYTCELVRRFRYYVAQLLEGIRCECPIEFCLNPT